MISKRTAETVTPVVRGFAKSGILSLSEVNAVERVLRDASNPETKPKKEKEKLLSAEEASKLLGVCTKTVLRMRKAGRLKGILVTGSPKSLKFSEREIDNFIFNEEAGDE